MNMNYQQVLILSIALMALAVIGGALAGPGGYRNPCKMAIQRMQCDLCCRKSGYPDGENMVGAICSCRGMNYAALN